MPQAKNIVMCGRLAVYNPKTGGSLHLLGHEFPPNYNAAPTESLPIIINSAETGGKELIIARWGLLPFWVKEPNKIKPYFNTRADNIKPTNKVFWDSKDRHCIVPAGGFYEWSQVDKSPYLIQAESLDILYIAGLWRRWKNKDYVVVSFSLITTKSNQAVFDIHHRSPVILDENEQDEWLSCDYESGKHLLDVYTGNLTEFEVDPKVVNNARNKGIDCVQPLSRIQPRHV